MRLTFVTPEKKLLIDHEVAEIVVPGFAGQLDILPGHAPLMTTLDVGIVRYREAQSTEFHPVAISWGYCEVNPQGVLILAETAETKEQVDRERAEIALKKAQGKVIESGLEPDQIKKFQRKIARAQLRIDLAKSAGRSTN
jgi:F-type H+-transporting ATPase subunit epsilon